MVDAALSSPSSEHASRRLLRRRLENARVLLAKWADAETARAVLWAPVAFGLGAACYLLLKREPPPAFAPLGFFATCGIAILVRRARVAAIGLCLVLAGFAAADLRAAMVAAPIIQREIKLAEIEGRLLIVDEGSAQRRLVIAPSGIEGVADDALPKRIRVSWRGKNFNVRPGDVVRLKASLSPPPEPAAPGGFDFARQLYFQQIGAVGFAVSAPEKIQEGARSISAVASASIEDLRVTLARRILDKTQNSQSGPIVAAVITGKRESISEEAEAAFRDSGLAHLLSISGLHMGLATGLIFFAVRAGLALNERLALNRPIKKWAAISALVSGAAYLFISGAAWPAQRAFLMSSIFFIAILFDRRALSLRNVSIAAFVILLVTPEAVLHPGFQMSFAAVTALIAFYEWASKRADPFRSFHPLARLRRYLVGIAVTDTIAAAATAAFSLYHFSRAANFGLAANLVSIPLMGFWVMPMAIAAIIAIPLGVDGIFWKAAAAGVDVMLAMGRWTTSLPGAVSVFPQWPPLALGVMTIGGLWLCLAVAPWRLAGIAAVPVAAAIIAATPHSQLYVTDTGDNVGIVLRDSDGARRFAVFDRRKSRFDSEVWMEQAGMDIAKETRSRLSDFVPCDRRGCVVNIDGASAAVSSDEMGLIEDCARAKIIVALYPVSARNKANCAARLIDRSDAWRDGAHAVYFTDREIRISNSAEARGDRPWSRR